MHQTWTKPVPKDLEAPVPTSCNDIFVDRSIHDHVGWVRYERSVIVPRGWSQERYFIRVEAATHHGRVYVNDTFVEHVGGYTPFDAEVADLVRPGESFRLTIAVSIELDNTTIPPGKIEVSKDGKRKQTYQHDFYNYSGLPRSVWLYSVPKQHIEDVTIVTDVRGDSMSIVRYTIKTSDIVPDEQVSIAVIDEDGNLVGESVGAKGEVKIAAATLWQPGSAYLYEVQAQIKDPSGGLVDSYTIATGIRTIEVRWNKFLIKGKPFYFTGFGKHEDTAIRRKGHDTVYLVHDFQPMDWIGTNAFRISHYPYAEEVMDFAERHGIVVIKETPAVGLNHAITSGLFGGVTTHTWSPETCNDKTRDPVLHLIFVTCNLPAPNSGSDAVPACGKVFPSCLHAGPAPGDERDPECRR